MKTIIVLFCLIPFASFATDSKDTEVKVVYQELCAKEHDPVKRQNYCYMFENSNQAHTQGNVFQQDTAIV